MHTSFLSIPGISGSYTNFDKGAEIGLSSLMEYLVSNMIDFACHSSIQNTLCYGIEGILDDHLGLVYCTTFPL